MKTTLLFLTLFLLSCPFVPGQDFAPVGAKWYYGEAFAFSGDINYILFTSARDTVILNETCRKITKRHQLGCYLRPENEYVFSRNDTVFFYEPSFGHFGVLYDFNATAGDSWTIYMDGENQQLDSVVVLVDSVSVRRINQIGSENTSRDLHQNRR